MKRIILIMIALLSISSVAVAVTEYVDINATGANDGSSWADAYTDLSNAITSSQAGTNLWIAAGQYTNSPFPPMIDIGLFGGFTNGMTSLAERQWMTDQSILSGAGSRPVFQQIGTSLPFSGNIVLDGFFCKDGNSSTGGGVMRCVNSADSVEIRNCVFDNNAASIQGGALYFYNPPSSGELVTLSNCTFLANSAIQGGSIYNYGLDELRVADTVFTNNAAGTFGGVMYVPLVSSGRFDRCTFSTNSSGYSGAAMYIAGHGTQMEFDDCDVRLNHTTGTSQGIFFLLGSVLTDTRYLFTNCQFTLNSESAIMSLTGDNVTIVDCDFTRNTARNGGALNLQGNTVSVLNSTFVGNRATYSLGGAVIVKGNATDTFDFEDCTFISNSIANLSVQKGGAMLFWSTGIAGGVTSTVKRCRFIENDGGFLGGAMFVQNGATVLTVENSLFSGNMANVNASGDGGAVYLDKITSAADARFLYCTFSTNTCNDKGGAIFADVGVTVVITNSIVYGNAAGTSNAIFGAAVVSYSDIEGGYSGAGNIDADPLFASDFSILSGSPCVGAAIDIGIEEDIDGNGRPQGGNFSQGAFSFVIPPFEEGFLRVDERIIRIGGHPIFIRE